MSGIGIGAGVPLISLRFTFPKKDAIPVWVRKENKASPIKKEKEATRSRTPSGKMVIGEVSNCSLLRLIKDLDDADYSLVNAFSEKKWSAQEKVFEWIVHFIFMRKDLVIESGFRRVCHFFMADLRAICADAAWQVKTFINPFYSNGEPVSGESTISINLEDRQSLRHPYGPPVMACPRDDQGRSMEDVPGVEKLPLVPDCHLRIESDNISIVENVEAYIYRDVNSLERVFSE